MSDFCESVLKRYSVGRDTLHDFSKQSDKKSTVFSWILIGWNTKLTVQIFWCSAITNKVQICQRCYRYRTTRRQYTQFLRIYYFFIDLLIDLREFFKRDDSKGVYLLLRLTLCWVRVTTVRGAAASAAISHSRWRPRVEPHWSVGSEGASSPARHWSCATEWARWSSFL